jgi:molecular chaperone GrpE
VSDHAPPPGPAGRSRVPPQGARPPAGEEEPRVVVRDRRRIDPQTGEVRPVPAGGQASGPPAAGPQPGAAPAESGEAARIAELTEDLQRVKAEYDNYRRRVERDRLAVIEQATSGLLALLLPVLDDVDMAREHGDLTGVFAAVGERLLAVTAKLGLESFGEPGKPFDPQIHEALLHRESPEVSEATAEGILRPGYRFAGRVLRPAQVSVHAPEQPVSPEADGGGEEAEPSA